MEGGGKAVMDGIGADVTGGDRKGLERLYRIGREGTRVERTGMDRIGLEGLERVYKL